MLETEAGIGLGEEKVHTKSFLAQLTAMGGPARFFSLQYFFINYHAVKLYQPSIW